MELMLLFMLALHLIASSNGSKDGKSKLNAPITFPLTFGA